MAMTYLKLFSLDVQYRLYLNWINFICTDSSMSSKSLSSGPFYVCAVAWEAHVLMAVSIPSNIPRRWDKTAETW
jgi:hypothetical protein